jgi:predicted  nucleic acid-binding Zn-ribbon protein
MFSEEVKMNKEKFKEVAEKLWPKTKKELEKAIANTKELLEKGERYIKTLSEKGVDNARKLSFSLKKEKLYYNLGKVASSVPKSKWSKNKRITDLLKEIKLLDKEINKSP